MDCKPAYSRHVIAYLQTRQYDYTHTVYTQVNGILNVRMNNQTHTHIQSATPSCSALQSEEPPASAKPAGWLCLRPDGDECLFRFVKPPVLQQHARQNEKQIKEAGNRHREDVWLLAIELSALFTPNETTFSTAAY